MHSLLRTPLLSVALSLAALAGSVEAQVRFANFDDLPEGAYGPVFQENGFSFFELDQDNGLGPGAPLNLDDFSSTLAGQPGFGPPNCLDWGAVSPGPVGTVGRIKSLRITPPWPSQQVQVLFYVLPSLAAGNTITAQGLSNGAVVAVDNRVIPTVSSYVPITMVLDGVGIDEVRILGSGPNQNGAFFACIDRVRADAQPVGTPFCFGDGTGEPCPCGNAGAPGQGCKTSSGQGGTMTASGSTSLALDELVVTGAGLPAGVPALLFTGSVSLGTDGIPFGDGVRCVGGSIRRIGVRLASSAGTAEFSDQVLSTAGWPAGGLGKWQIWFRDNAGPCGTGFNTTQGLEFAATP